MATEKLNPNGWDNGWPLGFLANVDEPVATADGQVLSSFTDAQAVVFDFPNVVNIDDNDIVSSIAVTLRCRYLETDEGASSSGAITAEILIGGISQGSDSTGALSAGLTNEVLGNAGWDSDWTEAQLNSLQLRLTTDVVAGAESAPVWSMDCVDVDITYTDVPSHVAEPAAATLAIAADEPVADIPGQEHVFAGSAALAGQAPILDYGALVTEQDLSLAGTVSYVNPVTEQLQINGWDNGWPTGFVANVDEPSAFADGQTVSTATLDGDNSVTFDLDNVSVDITNETDVLSVSMVLRSRMTSVDVDPEEPGFRGYLDIDLIVDGFSQGTYLLRVPENALMDNYELALTSWNQDWSVAQLNAMQVRVTSRLGAQRSEVYYIDTLDVLISHAAQSPILILPAAAALTTAGAVPVVRRGSFRRPSAGAAVLAGQALTYFREDTSLPSAAVQVLVGKAPTSLMDHSPEPAAGTLAATGRAPIRLKDTTELPTADTLAIAGKVATLGQTLGHYRFPPERSLRLFPEAPLVIGPGQVLIGPTAGRAYLTGKVPDLVLTANIEHRPAAATLALAGLAPFTPNLHLRVVAEATLSLSEKTPIRWPGTILPVAAAGSLAITTYEPEALSQFARLYLTGYVPGAVVDHHALPASLAITINEQEVIVENASIHLFVGTLNFAGQAPTLSFSSSLSETSPRLISLTVDRDIEFIATPTDILIE